MELGAEENIVGASPSPPQQTVSPPLPIDSEELVEEQARAFEVEAAESAVSRKTTTRSDRVGEKFMESIGNSPISEAQIIAWLGKIEKEESLAPPTLSVKCSLLLRYLRLRKNIVMPQARIVSVLKNKNARYHPQKAEPVTVEMVISYVRSLGDDDAFIAKKLYLLIKSFSAGRASEIDELSISDVSFAEKGLCVKILREKTDKTGEETPVFVPQDAENPVSDPVRLFSRYKELVPPDACRLFLYFDPVTKRYKNMPIGKNSLAKIITEAGISCGVKGRITSHSTRRGAATSFVRHGGSTEGLMHVGGWRSANVARRYVDSSLETSRRTAAVLVAPTDHVPGSLPQTLGGTTNGTYVLQGCTNCTVNFGTMPQKQG